MRNLLHVFTVALVLAVSTASAAAAPAPPHLEAMAPFQLADPAYPRRGRLGTLGGLSFSPDGKTLYTTAFNGPVIWIWDVASRQRTHVLRLQEAASTSGVRTVLSPDGRTAATWGERRIVLWDTASRKILGVLKEDDRVHFIAFNSDSKTLCVYISDPSWNNPEDVRIWDIEKK